MDKILVVDDVSANRLLLRRMLRKNGYDVIEAADGMQAVTAFQEQRPDLILMDINMPVLDGRQSTTQIKELAGDNYIPVIFVTALADEGSLVEALASGGDDFISKPFNLEVVESKVRAHLRIRDLNQQLVEHNRYLSREQEIAEYFFENALKQSFLDPTCIKYDISPMSSFCGDVLLAERGPKGGLYVLVGDFTGHGLSAAMGTLPVAQVFFKMSRKGQGVAEIAREINHHLVTLMPVDMFFTATLLNISVTGDILSAWSGGMPDGYLLDQDGEIKNAIRSWHMPLGILDDESFEAELQHLSLSEGDKLYLYTDGVSEARSAEGEDFGTERVRTSLLDRKEDRFDGVLHDLKAFRGEREQEDDITFVEVNCDGLPTPVPSGDEDHDQPGALMPMRLSTTLSAEQIRTLDPVAQLVEVLGTQPGVERHKVPIHTVLSEIYSNAVDHGLLGLDGASKTDEEQFIAYYDKREQALQDLHDGSITIDVEVEPSRDRGSLKIRLTDSGGGFGTAAPGSNMSALHGRGMQLVAELCQHVAYSDSGRTVEAVYAFDDQISTR